MTYKTFDELNNKTLQKGDIVEIFGQKHIVSSNYLNNTINFNHTVFTIITETYGITSDELANKAYGYENIKGGWPESKPNDFEALTRLVLVLKAYEEGFDIDLKMPNNTWRRFNTGHIPFLSLNDGYTAIIFKGYIKVGFQQITNDKVRKLATMLID